MRQRVRDIVESTFFQKGILALILVNAITLGIQVFCTSTALKGALAVFDVICLAIYVVEMAMKLYAYGRRFFTDGWNVFDFVIIALSLIPTAILPVPVQVARAMRLFRAFRVFRLIAAFDQMRVIVEATLRAIPGILWTTLLMFIIQYVYAVAGGSVFAESFPQYFGGMGRSLITLFEVMTLEGWNGVAEEVMEVFPWAWTYFISYVILSAFILMNVVVGVIVNSIEESRPSIDASLDKTDGNDDALLEAQLDELEEQVEEVRRLLDDRKRARARSI